MKMHMRILIAAIMIALIPISTAGYSSAYTVNSSSETWVSSMKTEYETNDTIVYSPPNSLEFGMVDFLWNAPRGTKIQNVAIPHLFFGIDGSESYWVMENFMGRIKTLGLHAVANERGYFTMDNSDGRISRVFFYIASYAVNSTGSIMGHSFRVSNDSKIIIDDLGVSLSADSWYLISYNYSYYKFTLTEYSDFNKIPIGEFTSDTQYISISITSSVDGGVLWVDGAEYIKSDALHFDAPFIHKWKSPDYVGINTTRITIECNIDFPSSDRVYSVIDPNYNSSFVIVSYRNFVNSSYPTYAFYVAKIYRDIPVYKYSTDGITWNAVWSGDSFPLEIIYNPDGTVNTIKVGDYTIPKYTNDIHYYLQIGYKFGILHEGYINENYTMRFTCTIDGILPPLKYTISYDNQRSVIDLAWIEVKAENVWNEKSGIFAADGRHYWYLVNGYAKVYISNVYDSDEMNFAVLLYSLDGKLAVRKDITLGLFLLRGEDDAFVQWIETNWPWVVLSIIAFSGIAIMYVRKRRFPVFTEPPAEHVKTFYPHIGEVPDGCSVKNGKLVCPPDGRKKK